MSGMGCEHANTEIHVSSFNLISRLFNCVDEKHINAIDMQRTPGVDLSKLPGDYRKIPSVGEASAILSNNGRIVP